MNAKLKVLHAGPSISVQDAGRRGHLRFGVSGSGVMDKRSYALANSALGNSESNPAIEISLGGFSVMCTEGSVLVALVGGRFASTLNDAPLPAWCLFSFKAGDTLTVKPGNWGSWTYLCFAGQLETDSWLGSQSVHLKTGVSGSAIKQDDVITVSSCKGSSVDTVSLGDADSFKPDTNIRAVAGPQDRFFAPATLAKLFSNTFSISAEYDRMGMRLNGCSLPVEAALDMPSEPISRGSLQVPGHADPICLLADHHTAGGYPKIATVISADLDDLVQLRTGDEVRFVQVTPDKAVQAARERMRSMELWRTQIMLNAVGVTEMLWKNNLISGAVFGIENDEPDQTKKDHNASRR